MDEVTLAKLLYGGADLHERIIGDIMGKPLPQVDESVDIAEPSRLLLAGHGGVLVTRDGVARGFLARIDLVNFWVSQPEPQKIAA